MCLGASLIYQIGINKFIGICRHFVTSIYRLRPFTMMCICVCVCILLCVFYGADLTYCSTFIYFYCLSIHFIFIFISVLAGLFIAFLFFIYFSSSHPTSILSYVCVRCVCMDNRKCVYGISFNMLYEFHLMQTVVCFTRHFPFPRQFSSQFLHISQNFASTLLIHWCNRLFVKFLPHARSEEEEKKLK